MKQKTEHIVSARLPRSAQVWYFDFARQDESPLPVALENANQLFLATKKIIDAQQPQPDTNPLALCRYQKNPVQFTQRKERKSAKILQSESEWAMLIKLTSGEYVTIHGTALMPLQLLDRNTGECLLEADLRRCPISDKINSFSEKTRFTALDGALANERCEKALLQHRGDD